MMKDSGLTLFVSLPWGTTHTVRRAPNGVGSLKARLEVEAGLPTHVYDLQFGDVVLQEEDEVQVRGAGARSSAVLRVVVHPAWRQVTEAVIEGDVQRIQQACERYPEEEGEGKEEEQQKEECDSTEDKENVRTDGFGEKGYCEGGGELPVKNGVKELTHCVKYVQYAESKCFVALFMAAFRGDLASVKYIIALHSGSLCQQTALGRTAVHAAAAADQVDVLAALLGAEAAANSQDHNGFTPMDVATSQRAFIAERYLRSQLMHARTTKHGINLTGTRRPQSGRTTPRPLSATVSQTSTQRRPTNLSTKQASASKRRPMSASVSSNTHQASSAASILSSARHMPFQASNQKPDTTKDSSQKQPGFMTVQITEKRPMSAASQSKSSSGYGKSITTTPRSNDKPGKPRVKSAPNKVWRPASSLDSKPFMAFRTVPFEELRPIAVEYIPMNTGRHLGLDQRTQDKNVISAMMLANQGSQVEARCPSAPYSSLNNSLEDLTQQPSDEKATTLGDKCDEILHNGSTPSVTTKSSDVQSSRTGLVHQWRLPQHTNGDTGVEKSVTFVDGISNSTTDTKATKTREELFKEYTRPSGTKTARAQSAKYYRTQYHLKADEDKYYETIPRPRPATAGTRYRAWKTWLLQKYEEDAENQRQDEMNAIQKKRNARAFKRWLRRKYREEEEESETDSDSDDDYDAEANNKAFDKWLESKREYFVRLERQRRDERAGIERPKRGVDHQGARLSVYQMGASDSNSPQPPPNTSSYMRAYQKWCTKKKKYERWKERQGATNESGRYSSSELAEMRRDMVLSGCTYEQWLGHKQREKRQAKLQVAAFGEMSPRKY